MRSTAPTLDLNHEVRPQAGSAYDAHGRYAPRMLDRLYPVTAICVQCHRICVCADGTADWAHAEVLARVGGITGPSVISAVAARPDQKAEGTYRDVSLELIYEIADIIEQKILETRPEGTWWNFSSIAGRAALRGYRRPDVSVTLDWMTENHYIRDNGRGGCWVNWARKH
jgi:hypothetical protein